jgi:hypothetical protein
MRDINTISAQIIDAAIKVHSALGSGLLESAYGDCPLHEGTPPRPSAPSAVKPTTDPSKPRRPRRIAEDCG